MPDQNDFPPWDAGNPNDSLARVYRRAIQKADERIGWYKDKCKGKRRWSRLVRLAAIVLAAAGVLCPLIDATGLWLDGPPGERTLSLGTWGYVFFALAAAFYGFDKCFRLSNSWMRFMVTQLSLERLVIEFKYDWASLAAARQDQPQSPQGSVPALLQRIKDFSLAVETAVRQETDAWVAEFQSSLAELEKMLKTEVETRTPGSLRVVISNAGGFEKVTVQLGGRTKELIATTEALIDFVPPGRYEVVAVGLTNGQEYRAAKVVEIQASLLAAVEITLPTPPTAASP